MFLFTLLLIAINWETVENTRNRQKTNCFSKTNSAMRIARKVGQRSRRPDPRKIYVDCNELYAF